jgi:pimeloyl-ACP methyl ester carboxylesterase
MLYKELKDDYSQTSLGRIHYKYNKGTKQEVIFLHGFGASMMTWSRIVEKLPDGLGFYLLDLLGHGGSDAPQIKYTLAAQLQVVKEFIEQKELEESYLFGNSYGAWIAAAMLQGNYKGRGAVLEDAVGLKQHFSGVEKVEGLDAYKSRMLKEALQLNANEYVARSMLESRDPESELTRESLSRIVKPVLIIWGEGDRSVDVKYASMLSECIKGSALEIIKGAGHVPHFTHPEVVKDLLLKFIRYEA